jgi:hypothetical protein
MNKFILPAILAVVVVGLIGAFAIGNHSSSSSSSPSPNAKATVRPNPDGLPGLLTSEAPWDNNTNKLADRLDALGLPQLGQEGTVLHIHQHLDIFVDGKQISVPKTIGIPSNQSFIATMHSHDDTGVMHVESPTQQDFYLGQFFDVWGVKFTSSQLGGYTATSDKPLTVYLNGAKYTGDPRQLKLASHQEIAVIYGPAPDQIPSTYAFPSGE